MEDINLLELAKFMYQLNHSKLPKKLYISFSKLTEIHNYNTRIQNFLHILYLAGQ